MASVFARLEAMTAGAVAAAFAERVRVTAAPGGKYSVNLATNAPPREYRAIVTVDHGVLRTDGEALDGAFGVNLVGGEIRASFAKDDFPTLADRPKKGDRIQAMDQPDAPIFEIVRAAPDNASRIVFHCARVTTP